MTTARVTSFDPAASGLHFPNAFPDVPLIRVRMPAFGVIGIGSAAYGLCGGMAYAARDCFEAHRAAPPDTTPPSSGPAYDYLRQRLFDSWDLPAGPLQYYRWMSSLDEDSPRGPGLAELTRGEIAAVRAALDTNALCTLGLIRARSTDPRDLGKNHQVLAWGYDQDDAAGRFTLHLYDPNHPGGDTTLSCAIAASTPLDLQYSSGEPTRGFFVTAYRAADPGPLFGEPPVPATATTGWFGGLAHAFMRLFGGPAA